MLYCGVSKRGKHILIVSYLEAMEKTVGKANFDHHRNSLPGFSPTSANLAYETDGFLG